MSSYTYINANLDLLSDHTNYPHLPSPPPSGESSSDSDSSASSPTASPAKLTIPSSPPPPYSGVPSPPSSPTMLSTVTRYQRPHQPTQHRPKPILTSNPFPSYDPRQSSTTARVAFAPISPISPVSRRSRPLLPITEHAEDLIDAVTNALAKQTIEDDEYDCGWAMDLGAESSPSLSGSPSPGYFGASSHSSSASASTASLSLGSGSVSPTSLASNFSRRNSLGTNGAGAMYKRESESESDAGERLLREWAVAVAGKGEVVTPPVPAGKRTRGGSVSGVPPVAGTRTDVRSRRPSVSQPKWDENDRDCGICFEYAVRPARTICCGKVFCQEHLEDWLTGANASGLCPNCDKPCSLERDVLSLASPALTPARTQPWKKTAAPTRTTTRRVDSPKRSSHMHRHNLPTPPNLLLLSPPPSSTALSYPQQQRSTSNPRTPPAGGTGHLSPSLLNMQQQYERLLAQEHRPSSPLSTRIPISNPFDSLESPPKDDVLGTLEAFRPKVPLERGKTRRRSVDLEGRGGEEIVEISTPGVIRSQSRGKRSGSESLPVVSVEYSREGQKRMVIRSDADYMGAVKHLGSLVLCLVVMYLVAR
ncbi:hypothetical protein D9611_011689 [Ephemerocybe angulata]|uniref:RING-type domain-containing protein n=1 Tax=Ephemerocybe angulata TaxID=980116 RepID=A0A8H5C555_9AGAR|nr:hypothetical protein D9611_011689 [Tulosesus angulatus]